MKNHVTRETLRNAIRRIAGEEATRAGVRLTEVLEMSRDRDATWARQRAFQRIWMATGATEYAIAQAWGCGPNSVRHAIHQIQDEQRLEEPDTAPAGFRAVPEPEVGLEAALSSFAAIDRYRAKS